MKKEDITHLATLARIKVTDSEAENLATSITEIIGYVSEIEAISGGEEKKVAGVVKNVLREDEDPHEGGAYTEAILSEAPNRKGEYLEVKKILTTD